MNDDSDDEDLDNNDSVDDSDDLRAKSMIKTTMMTTYRLPWGSQGLSLGITRSFPRGHLVLHQRSSATDMSPRVFR